MVRECEHQVLRLPPYHCQYNPIELVWANCKGYYKKHTETTSLMLQPSKPFGKKPSLESHLKDIDSLRHHKLEAPNSLQKCLSEGGNSASKTNTRKHLPGPDDK